MLSFLDITPDDARRRNAGDSLENDRGSSDDPPAADGRGAIGDIGPRDGKGSSYDGGLTVEPPRRFVRFRASGVREILEPGNGSLPKDMMDGQWTELPKRQVKVQPCSRVQDGHSAIEQAVYNALWVKGKPEAEGADTRIAHVGHAELMRLTSLVRNALKANLRSLADKQAIEMLNGYNPADNRPSGYRVRGYKDILTRRRAAGMIYVVRGRSVRFCDERGGELKPVAFIDVLPALSEPQAPSPAEPPKDESTRLADLLNGVVEMDASARRDLIAKCRAESPSVRVEEIARVVTEFSAKNKVKARNLTGMLLTVIPRQFESRGLSASRARWEAEDRAAGYVLAERARVANESAAYVEREVARLREVMANPTAPEAERTDAAKLLRQLGR